jgi:hypothetical protein
MRQRQTSRLPGGAQCRLEQAVFSESEHPLTLLCYPLRRKRQGRYPLPFCGEME